MDVAVVGRFTSRHEGELARGFLEQKGIVAVLFADDAGGAEAGMTFVNPARLTVRAEDAARAVRVLEEAGYGPDEESDDGD